MSFFILSSPIDESCINNDACNTIQDKLFVFFSLVVSLPFWVTAFAIHFQNIVATSLRILAAILSLSYLMFFSLFPFFTKIEFLFYLIKNPSLDYPYLFSIILNLFFYGSFVYLIYKNYQHEKEINS